MLVIESLTWRNRLKQPSLHAALDVVEIPNLVQLMRASTLNRYIHAPRRLQRCEYLRRRVCGSCAGYDTCIREPGI